MKIFPFALLLTLQVAFSQTNIRVNYSFFEAYARFGETLPAYLQITDTLSYFEVNDKQLEGESVTEINGEITKKKSEKEAVNRSIAKRFVTDSIVHVESRNGWGADDVVLIKEQTPKLDWKLKTDEKEILGYLCKNATTTFRGRNYEAWYTTSLPVPDGPWKFTGLPGLILEIVDDNDEVKIEAYAIEVNKEENLNNTTMLNTDVPVGTRTFTWEGYLNYINENNERRVKGLKSIASESGVTVNYSFPFESMELYLLYEE